jgi:hypothetical protein
MEAEATVSPLSSGVRPSDIVPISTAAVAVMLGLAVRSMHADAPLWLDETFTGAIAAEPSLQAVVHQILQDVNAPLYYLFAHYWSLLFGLSNQALRFPAFVFGSIAPLLCLLPAASIPRRTSLLWCALTALWLPGLLHAQEARCYSLLLCLGIATTLAFVRLVDNPTTKRAAVWGVLAAAAISAHYYALVLVGLQGLAYLCLHGRRALRTWPAVFVFLPVVVWLSIHGQRIAAFADPQVAWYAPMTFGRVLGAFLYLAGSLLMAVMILLLAAIACVLAFVCEHKAAADEKNGGAGGSVAVAVALIGAASLITLGFWRPSFTDRYLVPFIPGILLGLALMFGRLQSYWRLAPVALVLAFAFGAILSIGDAQPTWKLYNFETASQALLTSGTRTLVFLWDHPASSVEDPSQLQIVGGFFFRRQGIDVPVIPLKLERQEDPNFRLLAAADEPHTGILWLYDTRVHDTAAKIHPPRLTELDSTWQCRDFGAPPIGVLACSKEAL